MPTLRATIGAFLAAATGADSALQGLRVLYPHGYFTLPDAPGSLSLDVILRANMVPPAGLVFTPSARFVFDVYRDILDSHRLLAADAGATSAHRIAFTDARTRMGDGEITPGDFDYFPVSLLPSHLGDDSDWTVVTLGTEQIAALDGSVPQDVRAWLERFNLLDQLGEQLVSSATLEVATVSVVRRWFDPDVLAWDFWDIDGDPISDGHDPSVGRMPGYVVRLVAVRRFVLTLSAVELPQTSGVIYRRSGPVEMAPTASPGDVLTEVSGARPPGAAVEAPPDPLAATIGTIPGTNGEASGDATVRGYLKLHVPFLFDTSAALPAAQAQLADAEASLAALEARGAEPVRVRDHRGPEVIETLVPLLSDHSGRALRDEIVAARSVVETRAEAVALLTRLASLTVDPAPHVVAVGCAVVGPCPPSRFRAAPSP